MKKPLLGCVFTALALTSCSKKPEAEVATPAPAPVVMQTPEPSGFAPAGVFFLVNKVSLETDSGIIAYPAGSKLYKLGNRYITGDGRQINLRPEQVTNDLRITARIAGGNPKLQADIQATIRNLQTAPAGTPLSAKAPGSTNAGIATPGSSRPNFDGDERKADRSRMNRR